MIFKNFFRLFKTGIFQTIATILLLSFFVLLQNILIILTFSMEQFSKTLKDKLGVYIYFREGVKAEEIKENRDLIIDLKTRLEKSGLEIKYIPKGKGLKDLSRNLPKIVETFKKYGMKNPIPPIMYIIFKNEKQYNIMKKIVTDPKYNSIILDLSDLGTSKGFKQQELRTKKIIDFSNFITKFYIYLSIGVFISILGFLIMAIKINFYSFYSQIEVEKLIGFPYYKIIAPFLLYVIAMVLLAFLLSGGYIYLLFVPFNSYFISTFDVNLLNIVMDNLKNIQIGLIFEFSFTMFVSLIVSYIMMLLLIKKV